MELARLESESIDSCLVVHVEGEIDASNAPALTEDIAGFLAGHSGGLVVDLSRTEYLDSAGIRMLFDLRGRIEASGSVIALAVPADSPTRQVLDIAEVEQLIPIVEATDEAVRLVGR
jgi:anti-sigma B factor antagonist